MQDFTGEYVGCGLGTDTHLELDVERATKGSGRNVRSGFAFGGNFATVLALILLLVWKPNLESLLIPPNIR